MGAALQPGGLQDLALIPQLFQPFLQLDADVDKGQLQPLFGGYEVLGRVDGRFLKLTL